MQPIFWLAALILFGVGEAVTVGLTSIWFALGSLGALIVSSLGFGFWPQFITFVVLSAISMALLRPIARKLLKPNYSATNADRVLGTTGLVTEEINNIAGKGLVNLSGQVWSARSSQQQPGRRRDPCRSRGPGPENPRRQSHCRTCVRQRLNFQMYHNPQHF